MAVSAEDRLWETAKKLREARLTSAARQGEGDKRVAIKQQQEIAREKAKRHNSFLPALQGLVTGGVTGFLAGGPVGAGIGALGGGTLGALGRGTFNDNPGAMGMLGQGAMSIAGLAASRQAVGASGATAAATRGLSLQTQLNPDMANPLGTSELKAPVAGETMDFGGEADYMPFEPGERAKAQAQTEFDPFHAAEMYGDMYETPATKRRGR